MEKIVTKGYSPRMNPLKLRKGDKNCRSSQWLTVYQLELLHLKEIGLPRPTHSTLSKRQLITFICF